MKNFLISYFTQFATYATIIVIFTHNALFDREVACTCKDQKDHCYVYISVPFFIIFLLLLWKDKNFNGICRVYCCMKTRRMSDKKCCPIISLHMAKPLVVSLLWFVSVLIDGDWYACCRNGLPKEEAQIPCKKNRTLEEQATIDNLKNESKIYGQIVLLVLLFLIVFFSLIKWSDCWKKCSCYIDGDRFYELIIIKEEEDTVNQILKKRVQDALTQKVNEILDGNGENKYMECYEPAQKVIDQLWPTSEENIEGTSGDGQEEMHLPLMSTSSIQHDEAPSTSGDQSRTSSTNQVLVQVETRAELHQPTRRSNIH